MVIARPVTGLVREVVVEVSAAIDDELTALATSDSSAIDLRNGREIGTAGTQRLWSFDLDVAPPVPAETPGRLTVEDRDPVRATILAIGDVDLVLGVDEDLGEALPRARLSVQPWFILDALRDRLAGMLETGGDVPLLESLLDMDEPTPGRAGEPTLQLPLVLSDEQLQAAAHAARPGLQFVWGPPGTGKTSTVAATVGLLATGPVPPAPAEDHKVLVVAHANAAVDVAMARVADALAGSELIEDGRVLRAGTPHLPVVRERPEILPDGIIARDHPDLIRRRDDLETERRALSGRLHASADREEQAALAAKLEAVRSELTGIATRLRDERAALIRDAAVVGTTLSKLVLDDLLWRWPSSAVVVDEASMSGLPFLVGVALRGTSTMACFGDLRQLPPIAMSERESTRRWFGRDVFELSGVVSRLDASVADPRLVTLRTQYRMGRAIGSAVGRFAYFDLLRTDAAAATRAESTAALPPAEGSEIVIVDTSDLGTACLREADPDSFSRVNLLSAVLTTSLAHVVAGEVGPTIGAVSPYRAQARLLEALLRCQQATTAATTHRFQGSERDAVLVDLADAPPQDGPSRLTGRDPDLALRLLNVGISRARGKLVLVTDLDFLMERHPTTSPARILHDLVTGAGATTVATRALVPGLDRPSTIHWAADWNAAVSHLLQLPRAHPTPIDVSVATEAQAGAWLERTARELPASGHPVTVRAPVPIATRLEDTAADLKLRTLGPGPVAFAGEEAVAVGSIDPAGPAVYVTDTRAVATARRLLLAE